MSIGMFRLIFFAGGLALMFCIETIFACRRWEDSRKVRLIFHLGLMVFNIIILRLPAYMPLMLWRGFIYSRQLGIMPLLGFKGILGIIVSLIVLDMFDYWWHRFNHRIGFLWRFHKVHHVDTHVDVTTSLRFHPGELLISAAVKAGWVLVLGPSLWAFAIFESGITLASQFHHCNIDFPDGAEFLIRKLLVTPRYHAAHHTVEKRTGDNNFSTIFIFWDKIFKTYREPDYEEMKMLGLPKGREDYLAINSTLKGPFTLQY